jgi:tRNA threonylcarbamoyl adenosine modification protein YjeE
MITSPDGTEAVTSSAEETEALAARFASRLHAGDLLLLVGELGAGKTTFVRGLARGLGVRGDVMSPTFQLVRLYPGDPSLAHVDLYRIERAAELEELGLTDLLEECVVVVEWGDRLDVRDALRVTIDSMDPAHRRLRLEGGAAGWSWS